jgi:S1-C subfamily serine protease
MKKDRPFPSSFLTTSSGEIIRWFCSLMALFVGTSGALGADFFTPWATRDLEQAQARLDAGPAESKDDHERRIASITLSTSGAPNVFAPPDQHVLDVFESAALRYSFPVDVLLAMAERDSGFNPLSRSGNSGSRTRGIINLSDEDVRREGINPYLPDQAINVAAKKLRGYIDTGMSIAEAAKAHVSGPNRANWGPMSGEYSADILARAKRLADTYYPERNRTTLPQAAPTQKPASPSPKSEGDRQVSRPKAPIALAPLPEPRKEGAEPAIFTGTGFFVAADGSLVTNAHVVENCASLRVRLDNGAVNSAQIVARDTTNDLALLRSSATPRAIARLRSSVRLGESVAAFGFPYTDVLASSGNFTVGNVTALRGLGDDNRHIQISAPVQSGNSGGPLLDTTSNVVGVVVGKLDALKVAMRDGDLPQNVNFAIKADILISFLDANHVRYAKAAGLLRLLDAPDLANAASAISAFVVCIQR